MKQFMTWCPRIIVIAFSFFISIFATDAFSAGGSFWHKCGDFLVHMIPTFLTLLFLGIAWNNRMLGGMLFILWGLVFTIQFRTFLQTPLFLMFSMPLLASGFLFMFSKLYAGVPASPPSKALNE